jgi:hypothetical protein
MVFDKKKHYCMVIILVANIPEKYPNGNLANIPVNIQI